MSVVSRAKVMVSNIAGEREREGGRRKEKERGGVSLYFFWKDEKRGDEQELRGKKREGKEEEEEEEEGRGKKERVCERSGSVRFFFIFFFGLSKITQLLVSFDRVSDI